MNRTHWNRKRIGYLVVASFLLWLLFRAESNEFETSGIISNRKPKEVWEFVADFNKMKLLNPTILNFKITSDSGNNDHWKYSVDYKEKLSHWPYWENNAEADFSVRYEPSATGEAYIVASTHKTCFFRGLYCLSSTGEFRFTASGSDTYGRELIKYECPPFFGRFCRREVEFQRLKIMENLRKHMR